ncbi:MAG: hypothetical protein ABI675_17885 [Chitinophagaceae bacterium]
MNRETSIYIAISIQTCDGPQRFGRFEIGQDKEAAQQLFKKLKGSPEVNLKDMLYIEFMELVNGLPVNLDVLTCDLQELGTNTMLISQEIFRLANLRAK